MTPIIIGKAVRGASHIQHDIERQDSFLIIDGSHKHDRSNPYYDDLPSNVKIVAVADGHGSASCPFSKTGSQTAAAPSKIESRGSLQRISKTKPSTPSGRRTSIP